MAQRAVQDKGMSIKLACEAFGISQTCYRYQAKLSSENAEIADWLIRLTANQRNWGFGLCFLYLRNVKGYGWNHKRVYRIYRELELNLRIKPKKAVGQGKTRPAGSAGHYQRDLVDGFHARSAIRRAQHSPVQRD
jgi:putative transposase